MKILQKSSINPEFHFPLSSSSIFDFISPMLFPRYSKIWGGILYVVEMEKNNPEPLTQALYGAMFTAKTYCH